MKPKVYIAGPMRGLPDFNYPAFRFAASILRAEGWHVENPAEIGEGFGTPEQINADPALLAAVMAADLHALKKCDAVYLLPGWEKSIGAKKELYTALDLRLDLHVAPALPSPKSREP